MNKITVASLMLALAASLSAPLPAPLAMTREDLEKRRRGMSAARVASTMRG